MIAADPLGAAVSLATTGEGRSILTAFVPAAG
jgi:hypothetical protein